MSGTKEKNLSYIEEWKVYRRLGVLFWGSAGAFLLTIILIWQYGMEMLEVGLYLMIGLATIFLIGILVFGQRRNQFFCPRCRCPFFGKEGYQLRAKECVYCKLPKYIEYNPDDQ